MGYRHKINTAVVTAPNTNLFQSLSSNKIVTQQNYNDALRRNWIQNYWALLKFFN